MRLGGMIETVLTTLALAGCPSEASTPTGAEKPDDAAAPPPGERAAGAATLTRAGAELPYAKVLARRVAHSDAVVLSLVGPGATCEAMPGAGDGALVAELVVTRFFVADGAGPSKRPLKIRKVTVGGKAVDGPFAFEEPFIEPTTATVMFGKVDLASGDVTLRGDLMAEVCLPPQGDEKETVSSEFFLSYLGARVRARGALLTGDVLRVSTAPLKCGDATKGDLDVSIALDGKTVSLDGMAVTPQRAFEGTSRVKKGAGGAVDVDVKGSVGGPLEVRGAVTPVACPR